MALIEQGRLYDAFTDTFGGMELITLDNALELIENTPTIDPIKAAGGCYCRECCRGQEDDAGVMHCHKFHIHKKPDGFCSDGGQREAAT